MKFEIQSGVDNEYLRAVLHGKASYADFIAVIDAMTNEVSFSCPKRLWDLRDCDLTEMSSDELRRLAKYGQAKDAGVGKGALLVSDDLTYGLSRIHQVFRESDELEVRVFRDEVEAVAWLLL